MSLFPQPCVLSFEIKREELQFAELVSVLGLYCTVSFLDCGVFVCWGKVRVDGSVCVGVVGVLFGIWDKKGTWRDAISPTVM